MEHHHIHGNGSMITFCHNVTYQMSSAGILDAQSGRYLSYALPRLEMQIGLILVTTHAIHFCLKRVGINMFVSSLLAGIVLGPSVLGNFDFIRLGIYSPSTTQPLDLLSVLGGYLFLFLSAVKMDLGLVLKTKTKALAIGVGSVLAPFVLGSYSKRIANFRNGTEYLNLTVYQSLTSFPVVAYVINQLEITNSELGRLGLASALIADIFGTAALLIPHFVNRIIWIRNILGIIVFLLAVAFIFRPIMLWVIKKNPKELPFDSPVVPIVMALNFVSAVYFNMLHHIIYMATYIIGFAVPSGPPLGSAFLDKFESFTLGVFLPIQAASLSMRVDWIKTAHRLFKIKRRILVMFIMFSSKFSASCIPPLLCKMHFVDSMAVASIMSCKGIVELVLYSRLRGTSGVSSEVFAVVVFLILTNSIINPLLTKSLYNRSQKREKFRARNVVSLKPRSGLRILTCIRTPDNIFPVLRLLGTLSPTKESPISVYALHLNELLGRDTPMFITHKKNKPNSDSISQNVIFAFDNFERANENGVSVNVFTAISPPKLMDNDICTLAVHEDTSLMIIPLHRKWSAHGFIGSESMDLRNLNRKVLNRAPCSVGIFFSRTKSGDQPVIKCSKESFDSVCVIFIGGEDDREALALAKRVARGSFSSLTVIRLVTEHDDGTSCEDLVRDDKAIEDFKKLTNGESVVYAEHKVKDGPDTALLVHSMVNDYDLFIVGRRFEIQSLQTDGLSGWSELRELGIIGDLLASKDLNSAASVLVVQKQKQEVKGKIS